MDISILKRYYDKCGFETQTVYEEHIEGDTKTEITVCQICGEIDIDAGSIDNCDICNHDCENCNAYYNGTKMAQNLTTYIV